MGLETVIKGKAGRVEHIEEHSPRRDPGCLAAHLPGTAAPGRGSRRGGAAAGFEHGGGRSPRPGSRRALLVQATFRRSETAPARGGAPGRIVEFYGGVMPCRFRSTRVCGPV